MAGPVRAGARQPARGSCGPSRLTRPSGPSGPRGRCGGSGSSGAPRRGPAVAGGGPGAAVGAGADPGAGQGLAGAGGSPGGRRTSRRRVPTTTRPWPSSGGSATPPGIAEALYNQAFVAGADGDFETAAWLFEESGSCTARWATRRIARRRVDGRDTRPRGRQLGSPIATAEEAVANWRRTGDRLSLADGLVWTAVVYARASRLTEARRPCWKRCSYSVPPTAP